MRGLADTHAAKHFCCRTTVDVSNPAHTEFLPCLLGTYLPGPCLLGTYLLGTYLLGPYLLGPGRPPRPGVLPGPRTYVTAWFSRSIEASYFNPAYAVLGTGSATRRLDRAPGSIRIYALPGSDPNANVGNVELDEFATL